MPICILSPASLSSTPYLRCYTDVLDAAGMAYEVFLWDRQGTGEQHPSGRAYRRDGRARGLALLPGYLGFRRFLLKELRRGQYSVFVVLSTQVAVCLYDFLRTHRFILDIRDHSHERLAPYRWMVERLIRRAQLVSVSSRGFAEWLPQGVNYLMSHNVTRAALNGTATPFDRRRKILSYVGAVRDYRANVGFLRGMRERDDWDVRYVGRGVCERRLEAFCKAEGLKNVTFHGGFEPEQKAGFLRDANFLLGIYGSDGVNARTLTPNRLYESCIFKRPLLVSEGTHLAELVSRRGLGVVLSERAPNEWGPAVDAFYEPKRYSQYCASADAFLGEVSQDLGAFERRVLGTVAGSAS